MLQSPNKFKVLTSRVTNIEEGNERKLEKNIRTILRKDKEKKKLVEVKKMTWEKKALREVTIKFGLKRIDIQEEITV